MTDRFEKLDQWLEKNNCQNYLVLGGDAADMEYWTFPGGTPFVVMRTDSGWEIFTPAAQGRNIEDTLKAAERQLAGGGTVEERIKQVLKDDPNNLHPIDRVEITEKFHDHYVVTMYYVDSQGYEAGLRVDKDEI